MAGIQSPFQITFVYDIKRHFHILQTPFAGEKPLPSSALPLQKSQLNINN